MFFVLCHARLLTFCTPRSELTTTSCIARKSASVLARPCLAAMNIFSACNSHLPPVAALYLSLVCDGGRPVS